MIFDFWGSHVTVPSDIISAWILTIILAPIVLFWISKKKKWPLVREYMITTNHRKIGTMYILFGVLFFIRGGIDALLIRTQLAVPENDFWVFQNDKYNELFSTHGTVMIFFVAMPLLIGLMNVVVPLQIGARDLAFPYLNAVSFWMFLAGALVFNLSFFMNSAPNAGWTAYAPLSTDTYTPSAGNDYYIFGIQISGLGTIFTAINMIVTIFRHRAPGMKLTIMPLFSWSTLITSFLILVAFPVLSIALFLLMFDRMFGTGFFHGGVGSPIYWQHLFWIFGHPEVYIIALPAFGIFSEVISTFSRKRIFGYPAMVLSLALIGFMGFMVWSHHMFTVGLGPLANTFFAITTMLIAVPTGIKIFNWLFTMKGGVISFTTPMLFALGFIPTFVMGGVTGVMLSAAPADFQFHDTYFVVAHLHYVIIGATILGVFAGIYYWYPKMTGKQLNEKLGKWHFWIFIIGFHMTFLPMHFAGLQGMPRRVYTYQLGEGLFEFNLISTIGAFLMGSSMLFLALNLYKTHKHSPNVGNDPWDGRTLEWTVSSPSPEQPFKKMPYVSELDAYWYAKLENEDLSEANDTRPAPVSIKTIQPVILSGLLFAMSISFIYQWVWLMIITGLAVLSIFPIRSLTSRNEYVEKRVKHE
ncbi:cytochrome c oxidase subunit I [Aquibacillus saliphilus]|uniref:cytochrome c oxidase subunit I n=1 Tax=Aquibacillus saliphilus TaxID=1909422 RepID=UPI001CEFCDAB|nr:cytochrome c oxidase subunit I [Aquibacillus saliphilus]